MNVKRQYERQNDFNRANYDKVSLMLPKGQKAVSTVCKIAQSVKLCAKSISLEENLKPLDI